LSRASALFARLALMGATLSCRTTTPAAAAPAPATDSPPPLPSLGPAPLSDRTPATLASLLSRPPDLVLTLRPQALARDRVYGPLLRRAGEMAAAYAGPTTLGTTTLGVLEQTDEVVVAENDHGREAVVVLRGVPASVDPTQVVDTNGRPLWQAVQGDVRTTLHELAPADPADASQVALFVAPGLVWVIAAGPAIAATRAALVRPRGAEGLRGHETVLLALGMRGESLVAQEPRLRQGALAPIGTGLTRVDLELTPGSSGLVLGHLTYATPDVAIAAEVTAEEITRAFHDRLERAAHAAASDAGAPPPPRSSLDWLGAASVSESGGVVTVRVPIPRRWLDAISKADLTLGADPAPSAASPAKKPH